VHHVIAFLDENGAANQLLAGTNTRDGGYLTSGGGVGFIPSGALGGWAPGVAPARSQKGSGFLLKPGTSIILQVHYSKSGKDEVDQTKVGLYFAKEPVTKPLRIAWLLNPRINIQPGDSSAHFTQTFKVPEDAELHSLMPHMHLIGKSMKATATLPDGKVINLVDVPQWDFNWQLVYKLKKPVLLPKGTVIKLEATYDNSSDNPHNPSNPPKRVHWGEETKDEMMLLVAVVSFKGNWLYVL
ncbi:MAG: alkyl hydroperoxide reductase, partial [Armatimonadota bacterium]